MNKDFLHLTPKRFLCPYCGEWHKLENHSLESCDSKSPLFRNKCACESPYSMNTADYRVFFQDCYCCYSIEQWCELTRLGLDGKITISSITESVDNPIVTFKVPFKPYKPIGSSICRGCRFHKSCNLLKLASDDDNQDMEITLGFEFEESIYNKLAKSSILERKELELQKLENTLKCREQSTQQEIKEDATMVNNIFNMNMDFGPNNDENIASTLMGVAVKNGDSWQIYNKKKKSITDVGRMKLGNLPLFILPSTKLNEGDLIKDSGEYYFVIKVEKGSTQTLCAKTGELKTIIPIKNVLGFSCYSKVIALSDSINMDRDFDVKKLALLSVICRQNGEGSGQMSQWLPLMLSKDKLGGDDDMMKIALASSIMSVPAEDSNQNGAMNQLLLLSLLKEKDGGDDDMMKMALVSSMMGSNMAGNNNPFTDYLMLDILLDKNKDEKAEQPALNSPEADSEEEPQDPDE